MLNFREFEETLCRLPSVDAVRVVGDGDRITEVHVLSAPSKSPKQVVRDIQSLAMARFGANVDRRVISVVQITSEEIAEAGGGDRPQIVGIKEFPEGNKIVVEVTLSWHGDQFIGRETGSSAASARMRLVGEATLRALEEVLKGPPLALDAIANPAVGMRSVVIAVVVSTSGQGEDIVVGSAFADDNEPEAAVRAVLDAMNRRIPQLLR